MAVSKMLPPPVRDLLAEASWTYHEALLDSDETLDYLAARGIDEMAARTFRLGLVAEPIPDHEPMRGRLAIPYVTPRGGLVGMKFRCLRHADCKAVECPKYVAHTGMGKRLYNVGALRTTSERIAVSEGELDAIVASEAGLPTIGCPGVKGWADAWAHLFEGFAEVIVFGDGDKDGREFAERMADRITGARAVVLGDGMDVTSFVVANGADALLERIS